jgi:hypothetical protein
MNFPIPKKDKGAKDVTPKSTGLKDLSKKKNPSASTGKSKAASLKIKSPSTSQEETIEIDIQNSDKESEQGENTEEHLLELQSDQKTEDESVISTYSEFTNSSTESDLKRSKTSKKSPTITQTIVQANIIPEVYLKDLVYAQIKALQA